MSRPYRYTVHWYPDRQHARWMWRPYFMRGEGYYAKCWVVFWGWWSFGKVRARLTAKDF